MYTFQLAIHVIWMQISKFSFIRDISDWNADIYIWNIDISNWNADIYMMIENRDVSTSNSNICISVRAVSISVKDICILIKEICNSKNNRYMYLFKEIQIFRINTAEINSIMYTTIYWKFPGSDGMERFRKWGAGSELASTCDKLWTSHQRGRLSGTSRRLITSSWRKWWKFPQVCTDFIWTISVEVINIQMLTPHCKSHCCCDWLQTVPAHHIPWVRVAN